MIQIKLTQQQYINLSKGMAQKQEQFRLPDFPQGLQLDSMQKFVQFHRHAKGKNLFERYYPNDQYITKAEQDGLWLEKRQLISAPNIEMKVRDPQGKEHTGLNFSTNNYLGLANHPFTVEAGIEAANEFGVNSAGSPLAFGATKYYAQLRDEIGQFLNASALIFSSGWLSCFGFVKAIVKEYDHVVIDEMCDRALFEGAHYTTKSVITFNHLDEKDLEDKLTTVRKTQKGGILVITDSLFAADSTSPDLVKYQQISADNQAFLLVNIGHDFGVYGANRRGIWEEQNLKELNNVFFVGSGSKTLGVNFAFIALPGNKKNFIHYWKYFCSTYMFTNAINPVQSNCGLATLRMMRSQLGKQLVQQVMDNSTYLRQQLTSRGHRVSGRVSPFVCVPVGQEILARMIVKTLMENNIFVNSVEYPFTKVGMATIRMTLTPDHTHEQLEKLAEAFDWAYKNCRKVVARELQRVPSAKL